MSRPLACVSLCVSLAACAVTPHEVPAQKVSGEAAAQENRVAENPALTEQLKQLKRKDIQEYVCYLCTLSQPERWEKAKSLLSDNSVQATCAFDKDHPVPADLVHRRIATMNACPAPADPPTSHDP